MLQVFNAFYVLVKPGFLCSICIFVVPVKLQVIEFQSTIIVKLF